MENSLFILTYELRLNARFFAYLIAYLSFIFVFGIVLYILFNGFLFDFFYALFFRLFLLFFSNGGIFYRCYSFTIRQISIMPRGKAKRSAKPAPCLNTPTSQLTSTVLLTITAFILLSLTG